MTAGTLLTLIVVGPFLAAMLACLLIALWAPFEAWGRGEW